MDNFTIFPQNSWKVNGHYPELVFLSIVFSYSTVSAVLILNTSVLDPFFDFQKDT